jgi:hypothetical protein
VLKEFALEPEALASWESFRYLIEKFGVSHGRVISRFPKQWKRLVYEAAQKALSGTAQLSRIEVKLNALGDDVVFPTARPGGDGSKPWIERALVEHAREPFAGIIARANPRNQAHVLLHSDVDEQDPRFHSSSQMEIERTAANLVGCASFLLRHTTTVKWVDHVMDLRQPRWRRPFCEALNVLTRVGRPVHFELHRRFGNEIEKRNLRQQYEEAFRRYRVAGVTLALYLHPEQVMHDRFILTERGGIQIGHGLDDNEDGGSAPTANVTLLEPSIFQVQWRKYSDEASLVMMFDP